MSRTASRNTRGSGALALLTLALSTAAVAVVGVATQVVGAQARPSAGNVVEVWVAAVPVTWNVVPNGHDAIEHMHFDPAETTFRTVVYRQFTPDFAKPIPNTQGNRGIQGPLIRARVGDTILVHFRNLDTAFNRPHSMHFHGVEYRFGSDGSYIPGFSGPGASVKPGSTFTYRLVAGPDSAGVWPYHDHSPSMMDSIGGGLYGALSILGPGEKAPDREFVVYLESHQGFMTIDGRAFVGNTPVFRARVGETVQWDVLTLGDDFHTFHVHGHRWHTPDGASRDTQVLGPAESYRIRWREDAPGTWLYHCHVESHMMNGMIGIYRVAPVTRLLVAVLGAWALVAAVAAVGADAPTREIAMPGKLYEPAHVRILAGTTVTWRNGDSVNHTVTSEGDAFDSSYVAPGGSFSFTFARQGHYAYHCQIHKFMKGTVDVFSLVLTGPENPVPVGRQVVVAGLAPAGTASVTLSRVGGGEPARSVKPRPDGSFTVRFGASSPGAYRATVGKASSPLVSVSVLPRIAVVRFGNAMHVTTVPARPGAPVVLQEYERDYFTWRTIVRARLDANSRARLTIPPGRPVRLRVVVRGTAGWADAVSQQIVLGR